MIHQSKIRKYNLILAVITALFVVALHIPFLQADPDYNISLSRSANTDEGLYSLQIRNFINHGDLSFKNADGFLKTPLFSGVLYLPFKLFGTRLTVARLTVLIISLLICWVILGYDKYYGALGFLALIFVFTEYHVFHFFHYALAEILSVSLIFLAIFLMTNSDKTKVRVRDSLFPALCITAAYFIKLQFIYAIAILPLALIVNTITHKGHRKVLFWQFMQTSAILSAGLLAYYVVWYIPNHEFYDFVVRDQTFFKFASFTKLYNHPEFPKSSLFLKDELRSYFLSSIILSIVGIVLLIRKSSLRFSYLFVAFACWFLVELYLVTMVHLATDYISFYFAMGMIMSVVVLELFRLRGSSWYIIASKILLALFLLSFVVHNASSYYESYKRRTFVIRETDKYFSDQHLRNQVVMGNWAPSLTWKSKAKTYPVWMNFMNDKDIIKKYNPAVIIAENDQEDSDQAYSLQGIDLDEISDSVKTVQINDWTLNIFWLKQPTEH